MISATEKIISAVEQSWTTGSLSRVVMRSAWGSSTSWASTTDRPNRAETVGGLAAEPLTIGELGVPRRQVIRRDVTEDMAESLVWVDGEERARSHPAAHDRPVLDLADVDETLGESSQRGDFAEHPLQQVEATNSRTRSDSDLNRL